MTHASVCALHVYPLKAAAGLSITSADLDDFGLAGDRRWMLITRDGVAITQRELPRLCLVRVSPESGGLILRAPGMPDLEVGRIPATGGRIRVKIWRDTCDAIDVGDAAARWFGEFLKHPCRLAHMPDDADRRVDPAYSPTSERVSFADGYPLLLTSEASLEDLNRRLPAPLPMNRFRPNVVVRDTAPFEEDHWRRIRIGGLLYRVVKPCVRCVVTTTNQTTAERGQEPLRTLATYRKIDDGVAFGQNLIHEGRGRIAVGMEINVEEPV